MEIIMKILMMLISNISDYQLSICMVEGRVKFLVLFVFILFYQVTVSEQILLHLKINVQYPPPAFIECMCV
jgi:hypothetical protein